MATVYKSGELIASHGYEITGAVSLLLENPEDIKAFSGLCILAPQIPDDPIEAVYKAILDPKFDLTKWESWLHKMSGDKRLMTTNSSSGLPQLNYEFYGDNSDINFLVKELAFVFEAWKLQKTQKEEIVLIISIADPEGDKKIEIKGESPAFIIYQGSVEYAIKLAGGVFIRTTKILFSLFSKADSVKQKNLGYALRERQKQKQNLEPLEDLNDLKNDLPKIAALKNQKVIVIFLHGLLSTDLGTFDVIIKQLNALKNTKLSIYGYPHNTLAGINENAVDLANIIRNLFQGVEEPPAIYFVCHSRGGLLARSTAVKLYDISPKYKKAIRQAITFGTPHEGSELAEKPDDLKALFVASQFYRAYGLLHGFGELLQLLSEPKEFTGIKDLKPREQNPKGFIVELCEEEGEQVRGEDKARNLIIKAVGGKANNSDSPNKDFITRKINSFAHYVANQIMDEESHDLVVRTVSSVNSTIGLEVIGTWACNHFEYFQEANSDRLKFISGLIEKELRKESIQLIKKSKS